MQKRPKPNLEDTLKQSPEPKKKKDIVNYAFDGIGLMSWGATTGILYPILQQYLPIAEKAAQVSVTISDLPLNLDQIVETVANSAARIGGQGAEAAIAGLGALAAGYLTFLAFDWLGDDYRPQKMVKAVWERTGQRAITGVKSSAKKTGRNLRYKILQTKDRITKGRSADDYDMGKRFDEANRFVEEFPAKYDNNPE